MQTIETPSRIVLAPDDLRQLRAVRKVAEQARKDGDIAVTRARLAILEADRELVQCFEELAARYHFDPHLAWQFDEAGAIVLATPTGG